MNERDEGKPPDSAHESMGVRQASKMQTRHQLLETGLRLFAETGYDATTVGEIAAQAGVAVGTVYFHFGDKEGLLGAILLQAVEDLYQFTLPVFENPPDDPDEFASRYYRALFDFIEQDLPGRRFLIGILSSPRSVSREARDHLIHLAEQNFRMGIEKGMYRADLDPHLVARAENGKNLALLTWWAEDPSRASKDEIIRTLIRTGAEGLNRQSVV